MIALPRTSRWSVKLSPTPLKVLLGCGVASSVAYIATDIVAALRYPGYSYLHQAFSELAAEDAPTRPFIIAAVGVPYGVLVGAFAGGVAAAAGGRRFGRLTSVFLAGYALAGTAGAIVFPMNMRGTDGSTRNVMHIPTTAVMSLCLMLAMGFGSTLLGRRFRVYTYSTLATLLIAGGLAAMQGSNVAANEPTRWLGLEERVNIYATMLWIAVFAVALWHQQHSLSDGQPPPASLQL